jgi:branched-chain amino acid transport system permease protein
MTVVAGPDKEVQPRGGAVAVRSRLRPALSVAGLAVLLAGIPLLLSDYWVFLFAQVLVYGIATQGLNILYGRTGQLSLAHATFLGGGAYTTYVVITYGYSPLAALVVAWVVSLVAGLVVAVPTLRLSGLRLALVTLAFGELFQWVIVNTTETTGGTQGTPVDSIVAGSIDTAQPLWAYVLALCFAVPATLLALQLGRTQLGRGMLAVRESELAAASAGVAIARTKIIAFVAAALFAGTAGWLYAFTSGFLAPTDFDLFASVYLLVAVILGGSGSVLGSWLGAAYIVLVPQLLNQLGFPNLYSLVGGAVLVVVALLVPDGMAGLLVSGARRLRRIGTGA